MFKQRYVKEKLSKMSAQYYFITLSTGQEWTIYNNG